MPDFAAAPIWLNGIAFAASAGFVWLAGTRLSYYVDAILRHTSLGQAVAGVLLLGGITSLPEIATAGAASVGGNAPLAVNNLLGGFAMQVAILAIADLLIRDKALTFVVPNPVVLLQGALGIILVALVAVGIAVGDIPILGAGAWTWAVFGFFLFSIWLVARSERSPAWQVVGQPQGRDNGQVEPKVERSLKKAVTGTAIAGLVILVMGYALAGSGEALADQTGLGSSFFGAVFVAISTSLPEVSTVLAAVRLGRYVMAMSDIFGTNLFDIALVFLVDLLFLESPVLNHVGTFSILAGLLGILVTAFYLVGLVERRDPVVLGVGLDTLAVIVTYLGGIALLYGLS